MTEKTTEEVVVSEATGGQQTENQSRKKPAARKAATTRKKAAKKDEAVEPATEAEAPAKKTASRRGRKPKETAVEAAQTVAGTSDEQTTSDVHAQSGENADNATEQPVAEPQAEQPAAQIVEEKTVEEVVVAEEPKVEQQKTATPAAGNHQSTSSNQQKVKAIPAFNPVRIDSIVDMVNAPKNQLLLNDQQIQQLSLDEAVKRFRWIEGTLAWVLNYDVVISDTNIWLELLVGHTSSHSDPKVNARLMFERQLEFISKLVRFRGGRFMMMSETYEEIDRFATQQAPTNYKDADFNDEALCRNVSARLAKRLILSQQRENRLKIEGICAESHHAAFADPAIIRKTVELFSTGKRVLLLTNDASVAIRSMGMCDDLQRINDIDDETWEHVYSPLRPMVITMEDLKVLDLYTRQYHFLQMAAGKQWMEDVPQRMEKRNVEPLALWLDGFRPGDKQSEMHKQQKQQGGQQKQQNQPKQEQKQQQQQKQKQQKQNNNQQKQQQDTKQEQPKVQETVVEQTKQPQQPKPEKQPKAEPVQEKVEAKMETADAPVANSQEAPLASEATDMQVIQDIPGDNEMENAAEQPKQQRRRPQRRRPQRNNNK